MERVRVEYLPIYGDVACITLAATGVMRAVRRLREATCREDSRYVGLMENEQIATCAKGIANSINFQSLCRRNCTFSH
eukprot:2300952-Amphidinium_carterae.1